VLQIAICGEGPVAHSIAAVCGWRGHRIRVWAHQPRRWRDWMDVTLRDGSSFVAPLDAVTANPGLAVGGADIIFICVPHCAIERTLQVLEPHVDAETLVGAIPGFGGFGLTARRAMPRVGCFFGTQRIPFVVRGHTPGRAVTIGGVRRQTFVGTMPAGGALPVAELLHEVLGVRTVPVSHFLNVELSPSNSIVNPARLYTLFGPAAKKAPLKRQEFFLDWDGNASKLLLRLDKELQAGRQFIPRDTSFVAPILLQYDANDARTLTKRFRNLRGLANRFVPLRGTNGRSALDLGSDYVREDIDHVSYWCGTFYVSLGPLRQ
jgi:opine dehydrogenase